MTTKKEAKNQIVNELVEDEERFPLSLQSISALMDVQNDQSPTLGKLFEAKAKAKLKFKEVIADKQAYNYKYADLHAIDEATTKAMADEGLSIIQTTTIAGGKSYLVTTLGHSSGEWIRGRLEIKSKADDAQSQGSGMTYCRRYAKTAILDISIKGEDDDGKGAMNGDSKPAPPRTVTKTVGSKTTTITDIPKATATKATKSTKPEKYQCANRDKSWISEKQVGLFYIKCKQANWSMKDQESLLAKFNVPDPNEIPWKVFQDVLKTIEAGPSSIPTDEEIPFGDAPEEDTQVDEDIPF